MKQLLTILVCILIISACGISAEASTQKSALMQTATSTRIVSSTSSPTITPTPSHTPVPTFTSTPEALQFKVTTLEQVETMIYPTDFTPVSLESYEQLKQALPRQEISFSDDTRPVLVVPQFDGLVTLNGIPGKNIFFQQAVQLELNGYFYNVLMFKAIVRDDNGHNSLKSINLCLDSMPEESLAPSNIELMSKKLRSFTKGPGVILFILTEESTFLQHNPIFFEPLIGPNETRDALVNGQIASDIGTVFLWVRRLHSFYPPAD